MSFMTPAEIEKLARDAGMSMAEVCRRAEIAQSTFSRWKSGETKPNMAVYEKIESVVLRKDVPQDAA